MTVDEIIVVCQVLKEHGYGDYVITNKHGHKLYYYPDTIDEENNEINMEGWETPKSSKLCQSIKEALENYKEEKENSLTFEEALQALKSGKKIRQKSKPQRIFKYDGKNIYNINEVDKYGKDFLLSCYDLVSDDWEVCNAPNDFKVFIDKENVLYINGEKVIENVCDVHVELPGYGTFGTMTISFPIDFHDYAIEM